MPLVYSTNSRIHWMSIFFGVLTLISMPLVAACDKELVNGWGGEWTPFISGTYDKPSGLDMEVLDAVVEAAGCSWRNTKSEIPWSRHMMWLKTGELDIATAASWTKERAEYAYFTKPYRNEYIAMYVRNEDQDKFDELTLQELTRGKFRLGVELGNIYGDVMGPLLKSMGDRVEYVNSNKQNTQKLENMRIDGYLGFVPFDNILIAKEGRSKDIIMLPATLIRTGQVHFMLSKRYNSSEVFDALEKGLATIKSNGTYDRIIKKYTQKYGVSYW